MLCRSFIQVETLFTEPWLSNYILERSDSHDNEVYSRVYIKMNNGYYFGS